MANKDSDDISRESVRNALAFRQAFARILEDAQARALVEQHVGIWSNEDVRNLLKNYDKELSQDRLLLYLMLLDRWMTLMKSPLEMLIDIPIFLLAVVLRVLCLLLWPLVLLNEWAKDNFRRWMVSLALLIAIALVAVYALPLLTPPGVIQGPRMPFPPTLEEVAAFLVVGAFFYGVGLIPMHMAYKMRQGESFVGATLATLRAPLSSSIASPILLTLMWAITVPLTVSMFVGAKSYVVALVLAFLDIGLASLVALLWYSVWKRHRHSSE